MTDQVGSNLCSPKTDIVGASARGSETPPPPCRLGPGRGPRRGGPLRWGNSAAVGRRPGVILGRVSKKFSCYWKTVLILSRLDIKVCEQKLAHGCVWR